MIIIIIIIIIRFVFWIDNFELWRRHYDENKAHKIPAYKGTDKAFTTDHLCKLVHLDQPSNSSSYCSSSSNNSTSSSSSSNNCSSKHK